MSSKLVKIKKSLHSALKPLGGFEQYALLDYPDYNNVGDHLIWLGTLFYLKDVLNTEINYVASIKGFSATEMEQRVGKAPILLQGGGNLGDTWAKYQEFREQIITQYPDRPIFILPQSIYFSDLKALKRAADVFNSHPNLTVFVRENQSLEVAQQYFTNCQIILAPDLAFQMVGLLESSKISQKSSILYHCREDCELNPAFSPTALKLTDLVVEDWSSYKWLYREKFAQSSDWYWRTPGLVRLVREGWQRGLANPGEWVSRQSWQHHPCSTKFNTFDNPSLHRRSWGLMHSGIYQLKQYRLVITNRLHGHILCLLLGIPHVFLPNAYYKNESFYRTWTQSVEFCRFVKDATQVKEAVQELWET